MRARRLLISIFRRFKQINLASGGPVKYIQMVISARISGSSTNGSLVVLHEVSRSKHKKA